MPVSPHDLKWTASEKKSARRIFESALAAELGELMTVFKLKASRASTPDDLWAIESFLSAARREIDAKYDFRYSRLIFLFGALLREGRVHASDLNAFSEDKLAYIRGIASL